MSDVMNAVKELKVRIEKRDTELDRKADEALKAQAKHGEITDGLKAEIDVLLSAKTADQKTLNELEVRLGEAEKLFASFEPANGKPKSQFASQFVADYPGLADFVAKVTSNQQGRISVPMPRAALTSPDVAEGVIEPHRIPGIMQMPKQRLFVRDLISPGRTSSPVIQWVQQTGFTNNAAVVPENTLKPTSDIEFAVKMTSVATIAHLFKASKQILDDMPQLMSLIDTELRYGLKYAEEQQLLFGDGTGVNLSGIVPTASKFDPKFKAKDQNSIDEIRLAMLQSQLARLPATGIVMHFIDWAKVELQKDTIGRYVHGNAGGLAIPSLWGLPIVETEENGFIGKFLTGAFAGAAQIFDKEDANVVISTENNDDFEKNMVTIRCEERLAMANYRPESFIFGDFSLDTPSGD